MPATEPTSTASAPVIGTPGPAGPDENAEIALAASGLSKAYPGVQALADLSLTVRRGEVVGVVGENGAGKSTFLGIVNGGVVPDAGTLTIEGHQMRFGKPGEAAKHGVATVYQEQGLVPTMSVYENLFLGRERRFVSGGFVNHAAMQRAARETLEGLGVEVDETAWVGRLSFSQRQMVEIAKAFAIGTAFDVRPIILLDEPTSALSEHETDQLLTNIKLWKDRGSFVFVSHRLAHVFQVCDRIAALKDGELIAQLGVDAIDEGGLHELIVGRKRDVEYYKEKLQRKPDAEVMLEVRGASRAGQYADVSFELRRGEILGIAGVAGCGKSELIRAVMGLEKLDTGELALGGAPLSNGSLSEAVARGAAYIPADRHREGIILDHSIQTNMTLPVLDSVRGGSRLISRKAEGKLARKWIERLDIKVRSPETIAKTLSGGNQQKVVFAKWIGAGAKVLLLDDPGRGLDVGAKESIYTLLRELAQDGAAIVLVSDNLPELIGLSNRILVMRGGEVTAELMADVDAKPTEAEVVQYMV